MMPAAPLWLVVADTVSAAQRERWQQAVGAERVESLPSRRDLSRRDDWPQLLLWGDEEGLALQALAHPLPGPVRVDFVSGALAWRTRPGVSAAGEMVGKACGARKGATPRVVDATAGLGRDAWILATLGCEVTLCERSPVIAALLADGLARAAAVPELAATVARMTLLPGDSVRHLQDWLADEQRTRPEVVYLDPMFPHRDKSAQVKQDMRLFRDVVGADPDADALLPLARALASRRVVVKRPRLAPDLAGQAPHQRMTGQSNRFDLYAPQALSQGASPSRQGGA